MEKHDWIIYSPRLLHIDGMHTQGHEPKKRIIGEVGKCLSLWRFPRFDINLRFLNQQNVLILTQSGWPKKERLFVDKSRDSNSQPLSNFKTLIYHTTYPHKY